MANSPLIVATASNKAYFQGLCVTLMSAVHSTSPEAAIRIYVLDTGLTDKNHTDLRRLIATLRPDCEIIFQPVTGDCFKGMNTDYGGGYSTYARLLVASLIPEPKAIYLDADFLVLRDLSELWDEPITPHLMLATADLDTANGEPKRLSRDCPFLPTEESNQFYYHNCGFLFIDLDAWRRENIESAAFESVKGFETQLKAWDQTLLNYVLRGRIGRLPGTWNQSCSIEGIPGDANIHYISMRKPWNHWSPMPMYRAWYLFHRLFIHTSLPLQLHISARLKGALCHLRDHLFVKISTLRRCYLNQMCNRKNKRTADAYDYHLQQLTNAKSNPEWRSNTSIVQLKKKWNPKIPQR